MYAQVVEVFDFKKTEKYALKICKNKKTYEKSIANELKILKLCSKNLQQLNSKKELIANYQSIIDFGHIMIKLNLYGKNFISS